MCVVMRSMYVTSLNKGYLNFVKSVMFTNKPSYVWKFTSVLVNVCNRFSVSKRFIILGEKWKYCFNNKKITPFILITWASKGSMNAGKGVWKRCAVKCKTILGVQRLLYIWRALSIEISKVCFSSRRIA